jgi:hypothetical protein
MAPNPNVPASVRRAAAAAFVVVTVVVAAAAPASANVEPTSSQTCWLNADTDAFACFDTYDEFVAASGVAPSQGVGARSEVEPYAAYTLAVIYENASYGGASYVVTTSNSSLCSGFHYYWSSMPSGWNDRVSSFDAYGTCRVKFWSNTGYNGTTFGPSAGASSMGSMNDEASSFQIFVP